MNISKAIETDAQTISENNRLMAKETEDIDLSQATSLKAVVNLINDPTKGFYLLAKKDDEIIGQLMITYEWSDWRNTMIWWIQSVYVNENFRKQGVFKTLFNHVKTLAKNQHISLIRLYVHKNNQNAISTYSTLGMKQKAYIMFELSQ